MNNGKLYIYITPEQAKITHAKTIEYSGGGTLAATFLQKTENISLNVAASKIDKELLHKIMEAIMNETFDTDEELKLQIYNAIN